MESARQPGQLEELELDLDLVMSRFEHLMNRRPLLVNSVLLRQNPHNVHEWLNRVHIYEGQPDKVFFFGFSSFWNIGKYIKA
jgi:pre-mRNA-splicing factor SYF1